MLFAIIGLGVLIFIGAFIKSLDFNPFEAIIGTQNSKNKMNVRKTEPTDPDLTWDQWERENE
ncbi:MAG TPA: hypothetical protein VG934_02225 [Candidatus Paceibacterota bacterium]|nr:hypothetical protein [Candidatus Paceibacterota bacterium]